jgi:hypothetical protein
MASLKKQALQQIDQSIRNIEAFLQSDEDLTDSEQAQLAHLSWHFMASLSRWKRRQDCKTRDAAAEYPTPR